MVTQIEPNQRSVWRLRTTVSKKAKTSGDGRVFIEPFEVGKSFDSEFIAVGVRVSSSRDNWRFGGYLVQEFSFPSSGYSYSGKAFNKTEDLLINNVSIVKLPLLASTSYKLRFFAPTYFPDVKLQVWEYTGETYDTLVGNLAEYLANAPPQQLVNLASVEAKLDQIHSWQQSAIANINQKLETVCQATPATECDKLPGLTKKQKLFLFS